MSVILIMFIIFLTIACTMIIAFTRIMDSTILYSLSLSLSLSPSHSLTLHKGYYQPYAPYGGPPPPAGSYGAPPPQGYARPPPPQQGYAPPPQGSYYPPGQPQPPYQGHPPPQGIIIIIQFFYSVFVINIWLSSQYCDPMHLCFVSKTQKFSNN